MASAATLLKEEEPAVTPFSSLAGFVSPETIKAITVRPFKHTHMTPVQEQVLNLLPQLAEPYNPAVVDGPPRDLLVRAKTGTGKTLAFLVPAIESRIKEMERVGKQAVADAGLSNDAVLSDRAEKKFARETIGALIISPTRELASQIANEALRLSSHHSGFEVRLFVGGENRGRQMRDWMKGRRDIVVATPGRLRDVMSSEPDVARAMATTKMVSSSPVVIFRANSVCSLF